MCTYDVCMDSQQTHDLSLQFAVTAVVILYVSCYLTRHHISSEDDIHNHNDIIIILFMHCNIRTSNIIFCIHTNTFDNHAIGWVYINYGPCLTRRPYLLQL